MNFAIGAIVKNEADSLLEWIAFHRLVGIDHFYIADNVSTDATWPILKALQKQGLVTTFRFPTLGEKAPQLLAYKRILKMAQGKFTAVAFVDADEYITPMDNSHSIRPFLLEWFDSPHVSGVVLNWACFGSGGAVFKEPGLVIERFTRRFSAERNHNKHYKSIVRPEAVEKFLNPHMARLREGRYLNALGQSFTPHPDKPYGLTADLVWEPVRVNHYVVKSLEEFLVRKSPVGSAARFGKVKHERFFKAHDRNDETCEVAAKMAPAVKEEMARLEALIADDLQPSRLQLAQEKGERWLGRQRDRVRRWLLR